MRPAEYSSTYQNVLAKHINKTRVGLQLPYADIKLSYSLLVVYFFMQITGQRKFKK